MTDIRWYRTLALWKSIVFMEGNYKRSLAGTTDDEYLKLFDKGVPMLARTAGLIAHLSEELTSSAKHDERLVYERMKAEMEGGGVARQALLLPEVVELDPAEAERVVARSEEAYELLQELIRSRELERTYAALPLGHASPDAELDSVVERIRKALRANRASPADQLGAILRCSLDEQFVRVGSLACGACGPVSDPHVPTPLDRRARVPGGRLDGVAIPGRVRAAALPRLSVRDPATYGSPAGMPRPRHGHLPNSSHGLYARRKIVTLWM